MVFPVTHVILDGVEQNEAADRSTLTAHDLRERDIVGLSDRE